jgi:hypothetical protein
MTEIDDHVAGRHGAGEIIANVDLAADFEGGIVTGRRHQRLTHAATGAIDEKADFFHVF